MNARTDNYWLLVEPAPTADDRLETLIPQLAAQGLDGYGARQRLVGSGPALLARGERESLEKTGALLREHHFDFWILQPTPSSVAPRRIFGLDARQDGTLFNCGDSTVFFPAGASVLAVLADLSGQAHQKSLKRLLARHAYRGAEAVSPLSAEELQQQILRASPVLDLYLLCAEQKIADAVRIFPGKFDPSGLKERATYSGAGNLKAILDHVKEHAEEFVLHPEFGFASLPGCRPVRGEAEKDTERQNLLALTRFGWLMADLRRAKRSAGRLSERTGAAIPLPTIPLPGLSAVVPPPTPAKQKRTASRDEPKDLPPPPPLDERGNPFGRTWTGVISAAGGALVFPLFWLDWDLLVVMWRYGVSTGALPAIFSFLFFLAGFQLLNWKRRIENTPTSRARSLAMGMVELHGRAVRRYALVSPRTQMACVWFRLRRYRRNRHGWRLQSTLSSGAVPFLLDDGTGRVNIDPRGAVVRAKSRQEGFGAGAGPLFVSSGASGDEKWVEEVLFEGSPLYVLGFARSADRVSSLRERTAEALRRLKGDREALMRYDTDGDGRICAAEWDAARADVEAGVLREGLRNLEESLPGGEVVITKSRSLPFIIAEAGCQTQLTWSYATAVFPLLAGGVLLAATAAFLFFG